jgi:hypothetical protein
MSSEQSIDPQLLEQTKQQIRMLVNEIAQLAKSDIAPEEFYGEFLPRVISALAAIGGAVWVAESQGRLALGYQVNLQQTRLRDDEEGQLRHGRLLQRVLVTGEGSLIPPQSGAGDDDQAANPTDFLLVLAPLKAADDVVGVVEIFQRPDTRPATQKGYLRFLLEMCERAGEFFKSRQLKHFTDRQTLWTQLEEFTRGVHASLHPRDTAYTIANDGRRLIECDRVSVAIRKGNRCVVEAISGQDLFDKRSNTVRLLGRLASAVVASGEPVWYTGDTSNMAPQVEDAVQEYVDDSHSKTVAVLPLKRPEPAETEEEDPDKRPEPQPVVGALIVEQIEDSRVPQRMIQRVEVVTQHSATALANALEHQNLFLMPLWRALGKARWVVKGRTLPKTTLIVAGILALLSTLVFVKYDFKIQAKGTLQPVDRHNVFAGIEGVVDYIPPEVKHGAVVRKDQLLVRLDNPQLNIEITQTESDLKQKLEQMRSIDAKLASPRTLTPDERKSLRSLYTELQKEVPYLQEELNIQREKEKLLEVKSPAAGRIGTWDPRRVLGPEENHPVKREDMLLWIFDPDGKWQLEILMPDRRMGHIRKAQLDQEKYDLPAEFILATDPNKRHAGKIKRVTYSAEVRGDEGNTVLIEVTISDDVKGQLPQPLRPGATVKAKIDCGRRPLGYVLFHDLFEFIQSKVLFRWF